MRYGLNSSLNYGDSWRRKGILYLLIFSVLIFAVLSFRFFQLQVLWHSKFAQLSEENRIRVKRLYPLRGIIYDRNHRIIADNRPSYRIFLIPENIKNLEPTLRWIKETLNLDPQIIKEKLNKHLKKNFAFVPLEILKDAPYELVSRIEVNKYLHPEFDVGVVPLRNYICGETCIHFTGYVGEITPRELKYFKGFGYRMGDYIGKSGIELSFEKFLRGKEGAKYVEIDASGRELRVLKEIPPGQINSIITTINLDLQEYSYSLMKGKAGVILIMNVMTGEILVWISSPSFDPNNFLPAIKYEEWNELRNSPEHPLMNRVIQGLYAPGSTFKVVTALAGLISGKLNPEDTVHCKGYFRLGRRIFRDWKKSGHGRVNLTDAIKVSCDVYFYNLSLLVGPWKMYEVATSLGLGQFSNIEIPGEKVGLIPNPMWKEKVVGEKWSPGETVIMGIGQGYILINPLQLALLYSAVSTGGRVPHPFIVKEVRNYKNKILYKRKPEILREVDIKKEYRDLIMRGLYEVVNVKGGTGRRARSKIIEIAGKTGTAQVVALNKNDNNKEVPAHLKDHAWFVGIAPYEKPEIVTVVLVEHGESGGLTAAPIARKVIEKYLELKQSQNIYP